MWPAAEESTSPLLGPGKHNSSSYHWDTARCSLWSVRHTGAEKARWDLRPAESIYGQSDAKAATPELAEPVTRSAALRCIADGSRAISEQESLTDPQVAS